MLATDGTWHEVGDADDWRGAVVPALMASLVLAIVVAVFLFARRVSGALETPLAPLPLVLTAAGLLGWAIAVRLQLHDRRVDWLLSGVLAFFAIGCSFPGERLIDWLVWMTAFAAHGLIPARRSNSASGADKREEQVLQQLVRSRTKNGCETIRGTLIAEFAAGERSAIVHTAFCPPFEQLPSVKCELVDGPACEVKVSQILHQGIRLEARLSRASTAAQRVTIEILATDRAQPAV